MYFNMARRISARVKVTSVVEVPGPTTIAERDKTDIDVKLVAAIEMVVVGEIEMEVVTEITEVEIKIMVGALEVPHCH